MIFGENGPQMDGAHWLVLTQGLLLLVALVPLLAVVAARSPRGMRRRRPMVVSQRVVCRVPQPRTGRDERPALGEHAVRARALQGEIR